MSKGFYIICITVNFDALTIATCIDAEMTVALPSATALPNKQEWVWWSRRKVVSPRRISKRRKKMQNNYRYVSAASTVVSRRLSKESKTHRLMSDIIIKRITVEKWLSAIVI